MRFCAFGLTFVLVFPALAADLDQVRQARQDLYAARFEKAAELYADLVKSDPGWAPGYEGWVRALLGARHATAAYAAADAANTAVSGTAAAETAIGLAFFRRGEIVESERNFRRAIQIDRTHAEALMGLARVLSAISMFKTARELRKAAYQAAQDDPECNIAGLADEQKSAERIATMARVLAIYDPASRQARQLRARIASEQAAGDRKLRRLTSPYQHYDVKLGTVLDARKGRRGLSVHVEINQKKFDLLLDTGASGISISPRAAKRAGLDGLGDETSEARGIGDKAPLERRLLLASEVRVGDLTVADVPISAFAQSSSLNVDDGLIGADFFARFLVDLDLVHGRMSLDPYGKPPAEVAGDAANALPAGFTRAFRIGNHFSVMTAVNGNKGHLFLLDTGSSSNLIDTDVARETSKTYGDDLTKLRGIQGTVDKVRRAERVELIFAGFRQENPDLLAFDMSQMGDHMGVRLSGILGMPVLGLLKVTLDFREGAVRFEHIKP